MSLTAHQLALRLASHIEGTAPDPSESSDAELTSAPSLREADLADLVTCINGALQELWDRAPLAVRFARLGIELRAPTPVIVQVTHESNAIDAFPDYQPWMDGCTIRVEGDERDNEIVDKQTFLRPYCRTVPEVKATVSATVFADCAGPGPEVISVVDPIGTCGCEHLPTLLTRLESRLDFEECVADSGPLQKKIGLPEVCFVETRFFPSQSRLGVRLRVTPMPGMAMLLTYGARLNAPTITIEDIRARSEPGFAFPIPAGWAESVLLPLALQRFSTHPNFRSETAKTEIAREAHLARHIMKAAAPQAIPARAMSLTR